MFNEIYNGFVEILKRGPEEEVEYMKKDKGKIPHILSLFYGFDPLKIIRVKTIELDEAPNIILVLASVPENNVNTRYAEYFMINGKLSKIVLINLDSLMSKEDKEGFSRNAIFNIAYSLSYATDAVIHNYFKGLKDGNKGEVAIMGRFIKLAYYSFPIMLVKLLDRLYEGKVESIDIAALIAVLLAKKGNIDTTTIDSIRDLLSGTSLYDLLDNSLLLAADDSIYPGLFFADYDDEDTVEEDKDEKTI